MNRFLPLLLCPLLFASPLSAATLLDMGFTGLNSSADLPWEGDTTLATHVQPFTGDSSGLTQGAGLNPSQFGNKVRFTATSGVWDTTEASAVSSQAYFGFTVAPDSGYQFNLDGGSLVLQYDAGGGSTTYPRNLSLFTSVDGFTNPVAQATDIPNGAGQSVTLNLSDVALDGLQSPVEFRVFIWSQTATGSAFYEFEQPSGNRIQLNGDIVAIPEPNAAALLLLAGGTLLLVRRPKGRTTTLICSGARSTICGNPW